MLERVLGSTMAFFDTTPIGRIVNRFSKDIDEVDIMIPTHIKDLLNSLFSVLGTLFVICYASPVIIVFVVPMIFVFIFVQSSYLAASRRADNSKSEKIMFDLIVFLGIDVQAAEEDGERDPLPGE